MVYREITDNPFYIVQVRESPLGYSASYVIPTGETISETKGFKTKLDAIQWGWNSVALHKQGIINVDEIAKLIEFYSDNSLAIGLSIDEFAAAVTILHDSSGLKARDMQEISDSLSKVVKKMGERKS